MTIREVVGNPVSPLAGALCVCVATITTAKESSGREPRQDWLITSPLVVTDYRRG